MACIFYAQSFPKVFITLFGFFGWLVRVTLQMLINWFGLQKILKTSINVDHFDVKCYRNSFDDWRFMSQIFWDEIAYQMLLRLTIEIYGEKYDIKSYVCVKQKKNI